MKRTILVLVMFVVLAMSGCQTSEPSSSNNSSNSTFIPNYSEKEVGTSLHVAAKKGDKAEVKSLLDGGVDVNARDDYGSTPLMASLSAPYGGNKEVQRMLIEAGTDVTVKNDFGSTALIYAAGNGDKELVEMLIARGADVHAMNQIGGFPLYEAASSLKESVEVVELLIKAGADVNAKNTSLDDTPVLYIAAYRGHKNIVKALLEKGAKVNIADKYGKTPLHGAIGHPETAKILIRAGAEINAKDKDRTTPLDMIVSRKRKPILEFLKTIKGKELVLALVREYLDGKSGDGIRQRPKKIQGGRGRKRCRLRRSMGISWALGELGYAPGSQAFQALANAEREKKRKLELAQKRREKQEAKQKRDEEFTKKRKRAEAILSSTSGDKNQAAAFYLRHKDLSEKHLALIAKGSGINKKLRREAAIRLIEMEKGIPPASLKNLRGKQVLSLHAELYFALEDAREDAGIASEMLMKESDYQEFTAAYDMMKAHYPEYVDDIEGDAKGMVDSIDLMRLMDNTIFSNGGKTFTEYMHHIKEGTRLQDASYHIITSGTTSYQMNTAQSYLRRSKEHFAKAEYLKGQVQANLGSVMPKIYGLAAKIREVENKIKKKGLRQRLEQWRNGSNFKSGFLMVDLVDKKEGREESK